MQQMAGAGGAAGRSASHVRMGTSIHGSMGMPLPNVGIVKVLTSTSALTH